METLDSFIARGKCLGKEHLFLYAGDRHQAKRNRQQCRQCTALLTCAIYSANIPDKVGTWAGVTYSTTQGRKPTHA